MSLSETDSPSNAIERADMRLARLLRELRHAEMRLEKVLDEIRDEIRNAVSRELLE